MSDTTIATLRAMLANLDDAKKYQSLRDVMSTLPAPDLAAVFEDLPPQKLPVLFRLCPKDLAAEIFAELTTETQQNLIDGLTDKELKAVVDDLFVDDATDLVEEMPANVVKRILGQADPATRRMINELLKYPEDSAGGVMTTELMELRPDWTVAQAMSAIRKNGFDKETIKSPWFYHEVPFDLAAETGTRCVIREHATVGLVVTTDGSVADLPREAYLEAERRILAELDAIGKPYIILLNCADPDSEDSRRLAAELTESYGHAVFPLNCTSMTVETLDRLLQALLYEFPIREIAVQMPGWVTMLESGHWLQSAVYTAMLDFAASLHKMADIAGKRPQLGCEYITGASLAGMDLATGSVTLRVTVDPDIFYRILGEQTGLDIVDEASLLPCVVSLARAKRAYDKIKSALDQVEATGYGIVMPGIDELTLEDPEIVRQGGQYGVRLSASAPSLHIMRANIHTELSPTVGSEQQGEELIKSLLSDFETDPGKLWSTNIFGKSLNELVSEGVQAKLLHMPQEARARLQQTLERIINEGCDGLICILL